MREIYVAVLKRLLSTCTPEELEILDAASDGDPEFSEVFRNTLLTIEEVK